MSDTDTTTSKKSELRELSVPKFIKALERSGLVEKSRLKHALKSVSLTTEAGQRTAKEVSEHLVTAGLITTWQAKQLLRSKFRGFIVGNYVVRKPLGRGGMAIVYDAEHSVLKTRVALKVLPRSKSSVERSVSRFLAEARAAAKLNHPNIVRVFDCDEEDGRHYMVMDLVKGQDLGSLVSKNGPLDFRNAVLLLKQAAEGLGYAHEHGVTHRDVKPNNLLIDRSGKLQVTDMGLALFAVDTPDRYTRHGDKSLLGTVDYVAPEQAWDSRKVDRRADIYSLGCTFYFMLTGDAPFGEGSVAQRLARHQTLPPKPVTEYREDCPSAVWTLCQHMMAKKPQDRPQRMDEVVRASERILSMLPTETEQELNYKDSDSEGSQDGCDVIDLIFADSDTGSGEDRRDEPQLELPEQSDLAGQHSQHLMDTEPDHSEGTLSDAEIIVNNLSESNSLAKPEANNHVLSESIQANSKRDLAIRNLVYLGLAVAVAALACSIFALVQTLTK